MVTSKYLLVIVVGGEQMTRCLRHKSALSLLLLGLALAPLTHPIVMAEPEVNWNLFTHFEAYQSSEPTTKDDIKWGESALFLTGRLTDRLSFLSEISYEIPKYRDQSVKVERLRLRYDLNQNNKVEQQSCYYLISTISCL